MCISISKNWRRAQQVSEGFSSFFFVFSGLQNCTRKAAQTGRRRSPKTNGKAIPRRFFPLAAPLEEQVWKKRLRRSGQSLPESRYMVFCRDRTSLSDFSLWLQNPWKRRLLSYPLAPQTHSFSMKVEKKGVWENNDFFF